MSEEQRAATAAAHGTAADTGRSEDANRRGETDTTYEDPAVDLPGEDDYIVPSGDVGDANKSQGLDHMGGYGNRPIPQEPGPSQDH